MLLILIIFDLSFIARACFDQLFIEKQDDFNFTMALSSILSGSVFDMVPVMLILYIHTLNF